MSRFGRFLSACLLAVCAMFSGCGSGSGSSGNNPDGSGSTTPTLTAIRLSPETRFLPIGPTQILTATGTYSDGSTKVLQSGLNWASSNANAVSVTSSGSVTAKAPGSARITAAASGVVGVMSITATLAQLRSVAVTPASSVVPVGTSQKLTAVASYSDGTTLELTAGVTWTSSTPMVATVDSANGVVNGRSAGDSTVVANFNGVEGRASVVVASAQLRGISIAPAVTSVPVGVSQPLVATGSYSDGSSAVLGSSVTWASSNATVAAVDGAGLLTSLKVGSTTITASAGGVSGSTDVTVNGAQVQSLRIGPSESIVAVGTTRRLLATGVYSDGSTWPINSGLSWSSANPAVATLNEYGVVSGVAPGVTEATALLGSASGRASVIVTSSSYSATTAPPNNDAIFLGRVAVGRTVRYETTITNTGNAPLSFQSVGVDGGGGASVWAISRNTCTATRLEVGSQCIVELAFTPQAANVTYIGRTFFFFAEIPPETGYSVNFSGTGF